MAYVVSTIESWESCKSQWNLYVIDRQPFMQNSVSSGLLFCQILFDEYTGKLFSCVLVKQNLTKEQTRWNAILHKGLTPLIFFLVQVWVSISTLSTPIWSVHDPYDKESQGPKGGYDSQSLYHVRLGSPCAELTFRENRGTKSLLRKLISKLIGH